MSWLNRVFDSGYTVQAYPRAIMPETPDYSICDPRYGREIVKGDCKDAVLMMPWSRQNAEIDWAVNFYGQEHHLPVSFKAVSPTAPLGTKSGCIITIEVAGEAAHYDARTNRVPFTIKASPFQLRGLAAYVIRECVVNRGFIGGFATNKIQNLIDYVRTPGFDPNAPYPPSSAYLTVSVTDDSHKDPSPGNYDPSVAVFLAEQVANAARGANTADKVSLNRAGYELVRRTQKMFRGGHNDPWWKEVSASANEMSYECDAHLGSPAAVDCAHVEWSELGPDEETISLAQGAVKFLSSNTCQVAISAGVAITISWRQIRVALDTLFNVCVSHPFNPATGGRAHYGAQAPVSRRSSLKGRQYNNGTGEECGIDQCGLLEDPTISGLNALPPRLMLTVFKDPQPALNVDDEKDSCAWRAILAGRAVDTCPVGHHRPPGRTYSRPSSKP